MTPLHIACKGGSIEMVRFLLLSGAKADTPNKDGITPDIMALAEGFTDIAELLNKVRGVIYDFCCAYVLLSAIATNE